MTARKPSNRTKAAGKAAKTIDLKAEDVTERDIPDTPDETTPETAASDTPEVSEDAPVASEPSEDVKEDPAAPLEATPDTSDETKDEPKKDGEPETVASEEAPAVEDQKPATSAPITPPPAPTVVKKGGFGSGLFGGLLGGVAIVALGYVGLQQGMVTLPGVGDQQAKQAEQITALDGEVSGLKNQVAEFPKVDVGPIEDRIADVEGQIAAVSEKIAALSGLASAAVDETAPATEGGAEGEAAGTAGAVEGPGVVDLAPIAAGLQGLTTDLKGLTTDFEGMTGDVEGLTQRLTGLEALHAQFVTAKAQIEQLEATAKEQAALIETKAAEQTAQMKETIAAAQDTIMSSADRRINDVVVDLANLSEKLGSDATALTERVTSLEDNNLSDKMQSSARTIALAGLENATASGANYQLALTTFADVIGAHEAVIALEAFAEGGAPTKSKLAADFPGVYDTVLREAEGAGAATMMDKFLLNAQNLVKVRSLSGETKGESLTNKLGAIEFHVKKGDLAKAAEQWDGLPDVARDAEAGADWVKGLKARIAVDAAMATIRAEFGDLANQAAQ